ncbi:MAG: BrnT family toxin [Rubrivivax sp.]|nr:BrnT family toxin [Rubrivivax sp.]
MRFTFDTAKDAANIAKHGLSLADAPMVFNAPGKLTLQSPRADEPRLMDVATVQPFGVVLVLVYVLREPDEVRAISLRRASRQERTLYAQWKETQGPDAGRH